MRPTAAILLSLVTCACGDCADEAELTFFEPTGYGEYAFEPEPDIQVPVLVDFGLVPRGELVRRSVAIQSVGRLALRVDDVAARPADFAVEQYARGSSFEIEPAAVVELPIAYTSTGDEVRGVLEVLSNDPDESIATVALIANRSEPCVGPFELDAPVWELHDGPGPQCWPRDFSTRGDAAEFELADIPEPDDPGWEPDPDHHISFERRSSLCGFDCECGNGGDFTFFQTFVWLPEAARVGVYQVDIRDVDDGARVTVFNERNPEGVTDPNSYARIPGGSTSDLAPYLAPGENRIVITHVDDCCMISRIRDVFVTMDGEEIDRCAE